MCSYGWYIHYFVNDILERGGVAVLVNDESTMPTEVIRWNKQLAGQYGAKLRTIGDSSQDTDVNPAPAHQTERLTRGLVALPAEQGGVVFVSWRLLGTDPRNTSSDLVRDGQVIASDLRDKTNFTDPQGNSQSIYQVVVKVGGVETERTEAVTPLSDVYQVLQLDRPADGIDDLTGAPYSYTPNDCEVGDVDGDGVYELIVQWQPSNKSDNSAHLWHPGM